MIQRNQSSIDKQNKPVSKWKYVRYPSKSVLCSQLKKIHNNENQDIWNIRMLTFIALSYLDDLETILLGEYLLHVLSLCWVDF